MIDLSVGQVSGLIAVGVFVFQTVLALTLPMILVAFLTEENTIVTWSVLGRLLQSSHWPTILRTDTAASHGVNKSVIVSSVTQMVVVALVSIASIVTPLGLYDAIAPPKAQTTQTFRYVRDNSAFGYGTPPRSTAPFTRECGTDTACPGQSITSNCTDNGRNCSTSYTTIIPPTLRDLFGNGSLEMGPSISGLFDIQWRSYSNTTDPFSELGWSLVPGFRELSNLILDEKIEPVEGLIVDMVGGGIGFRNHTVPQTALEYGATWTEDILFIEPETECVDLNITLDFEINPYFNTLFGYNKVVVTDRGGFSGLNRTEPSFPSTTVGQSDLQLRERAYAAAWLNNFMTMAFYNVTGLDPGNIGELNITEGAQFPMPLPNCSATDLNCTSPSGLFQFDWNSIQTSQYYGGYLNLAASNFTSPLPNPNHVSLDDFNTITDVCVGTSVYSPVNINSSIVGCYLLYGAPNRTDGASSLLPVPGSPWSTPIYSCATAIKASIRTVTFSYNGTGLAALNITSAVPKIYPNGSSLPLWGVETLPQDIPFTTSQPLWGLLGTANSSLPHLSSDLDNISTIAQPSLYLPGFMDLFYLLEGTGVVSLQDSTQNLPGADFYPKSLQTAINVAANPFAEGSNYLGGAGGADYSAYTSLALFAKWQTLSRSAESAGTIIDLIWTDDAANAVVGTRGWGLHTSSVGTGNAQVETIFETPVAVFVTVYGRTIRYHIPFAVPAFVVLAASTILLGLLIALLVQRRTGFARMRRMLESSSVGRVVGTVVWPEMTGTSGKTEKWIKSVGERHVTITERGITAEKTDADEVPDGDVNEEPGGLGDGDNDFAASKVQRGEMIRLVPVGRRSGTL